MTGASPTVTTSTGTPCPSSTSAAAALRALATEVSGGAVSPYSQDRRSRSWARARVATVRPSEACFWISASVWRTESWRCAAMSARSCERTRAARSSDRSPTSRNNQGPTISASPATPRAPATTTSRATPPGPDVPVCSANSTSADTSRPTPTASRAQDAAPPLPTTARKKSIRPVLSTQRSRCASSACRHSRASPITPSRIGQNTTDPPNSAWPRTAMPMATAPNATSSPTSSSRRPRPGRLPCRVAASRPGVLISRWVSVGRTSQRPAYAAAPNPPSAAESRKAART